MDYTSIFTLMRAEVTLTAILVLLFLYDLLAGERRRRHFTAVASLLLALQAVVTAIPASSGGLFGGKAGDDQIDPADGDPRHILDRILDVLLHLFGHGRHLGAEADDQVQGDVGGALPHLHRHRRLQIDKVHQLLGLFARLPAAGNVGHPVDLQRGAARDLGDDLCGDLKAPAHKVHVLHIHSTVLRSFRHDRMPFVCVCASGHPPGRTAPCVVIIPSFLHFHNTPGRKKEFLQQRPLI